MRAVRRTRAQPPTCGIVAESRAPGAIETWAGGLSYGLVTGERPDTVSLRREGRGGARALRHAVLRLQPHHAGSDSAQGARVSGTVWFHASLRDEGEPEPGDPPRVPGSRPPRGLL